MRPGSLRPRRPPVRDSARRISGLLSRPPITGLYCPGCGTLRCLHALLHADLRSALDYNLLTVLFVPMLLAARLSVGVAGIRGRHPPPAWSAPRWAGWGFGVAFGLFWILRNGARGALLLDGSLIRL